MKPLTDKADFILRTCLRKVLHDELAATKSDGEIVQAVLETCECVGIPFDDVIRAVMSHYDMIDARRRTNQLLAFYGEI